MIASLYILLAQSDIFGEVQAPPGVRDFSGDGDIRNGALILFISNLIKLVTIIAGLFGLFNIIGAGYTYLGSAGNPKATEQAMQQLTNSLLGLAVIVGSFGITAIVSLIMFGNAMFILNPDIPSAAGP